MRRRRAVLISLLACLAVFVPQITAAAIPSEQPVLSVADAPIVRNTKVRLEFSQPGGYGIKTYLASNDSSMNGSTLANGVSVPQSSNWTLASGADGARSIYGQVEYSSGGWSQVVDLDLVLMTNGTNSLYVDLDPQSGGGTISAPVGGDWHTRSKKPDKPIYGDGGPGPGNQFAVADDRWRVAFVRSNGPLGPGGYTLGSGACSGGACRVSINVAGNTGNECVATGGTFTIFDLAFGSGGDLNRAEVDFKLNCGAFLMAGSIRYGTSRAVIALDQDQDKLSFGSSPVGTQTASKSVTITNFGNTKSVMGAASISGPAANNFAIKSDTCSGITLAVAAQCKISVAFTPSASGDRQATLKLPDQTPGGSRRLGLSGTGGAVGPTTVTAPITEFNTNGYVDVDGFIRVRVKWSSSGTVARYELAQQTDDDGNWVVLATNLTSTNYDAFLTSRHRYNFRVRAIDGAGNATNWAVGQSGWLWPHNETSGDITFAGSWNLMYPTCLYWDWGSKKTGQTGATATYTFRARSVAWVARKGPDRGSVNVYLDSVKVATIDLYANSFKDRQLVYVKNFASAGNHVLKVEVLGTSGHPYADVDAFAILD